MPKPSQRADISNFIGGLITEASPLNFPANASADELNFELHRDGSRSRRLGMDFEPNGLFAGVGGTDLGGISSIGKGLFKWESVAGKANVSFLVVQVGSNLYIYDLNAASISGAGLKATVVLSNFTPNTNFSFAAVEGFLVVVSGQDQIAVVGCTNTDTFTFTVDWQRLLVRDAWGVEEQFDTNYETDNEYRGQLDGFHNYNLRNQSWGLPRKNKDGNLIDPVAQFGNDLHQYPSNSEQVWPGLQQQPVQIGQDPFERIYTNLYDEVLGASTKAPKGFFIIDALARGTSRQTQFTVNQVKHPQVGGNGMAGPPDTTPGGASCVSEFSGHIFYSGFSGETIAPDKRSPNLENYVFFSQLIKSKQEFYKCYQDGDPTSRENSDIVDTDGGFIRVSGARDILALVNIQTHLVVIATNGIWTITGGSVDSGFTATNYKVSKISTFGGIGANSVVASGGGCTYWAPDGIYAVAKNQYGDVTVSSLTLTTIQRLYQDIPNISKQNAVGEYDQINKKIRWIYKINDLFSEDSVTMELIFDTTLNNFTQNQIFNPSDNRVEVMGLFRASNFSSGSVPDDVYVQTDQVFANANNVIVNSTQRTSNIQSLRYLTFVAAGTSIFITFSYYLETTFHDWVKHDTVGVDAKAHCLTGTLTAADTGVEKQIPYLIMHFIKTENGVDASFQPMHQSGCLMRTQWAFANSIVSNKWSPLVQCYRYRKPLLVTGISDPYDNGFEVVTTKNKVRGRGKAVALYFETQEGKDCQILGWNITINANQIT